MRDSGIEKKENGFEIEQLKEKARLEYEEIVKDGKSLVVGNLERKKFSGRELRKGKSLVVANLEKEKV